MSRTVIGYRDGHPVYRDEGPAVGRVTGFGGVSAGHFAGVIVIVQPNRRKPRADAEVVAKGRSAT